MLCPFRRNLYATGVIGFRFSCQDTRYFAELAAYFFYHMSGSASYGVHRQSAEHKGHHRPQEHARQYFRIHQRHIVVDHKVGERSLRYLHRTSVGKRQDVFSQAQQADLDLFYIRRQQRQSRQGGRADGESFTGGGCGVTQRVEGIGTFAYFFAQTRHFGISSGIVGNRTVSVGCQCDTQGGKHADGGDADSVKSHSYIAKVKSRRKEERADNTYHNSQHGDSGRKHSQS